MKTGQPYTFLHVFFIFTYPAISDALNDLMSQPMNWSGKSPVHDH